MYLTEYHHHTDHSFDSRANMNAVCLAAIKQGINEICFTDHFSVNPLSPTYGQMNFTNYFNDIAACRQAFGDKLKIKAGIELCEPHLMMGAYEERLQDLPLDMIMGAVHNLDERKLSLHLRGNEPHDIYQRYFEEVYALVSRADIDVLAHLDLMKRYAIDVVGDYHFAEFKEIIEAILLKAIERGIGIEINTSGLRNKTVGQFFPSKDIIQFYRELGGEIVTVGSDSHQAETVGANLFDALQLAKEYGFKYIFTYELRRPKSIKIKL